MTGPDALALGPLAMGCEPLGGTDWGQVNPQAARQAVRRAIDLGIEVFDTADVYGLGRGEEELSRALGEDRHRVTIVTKGGVRWTADADAGRARTFKDSSPAYLGSAIEASLRRLRIEAIPLYLVHAPDPAVPAGETLDYLETVRRAGKIVHYGISNFDLQVVPRLAAAFPVCAYEGECSLMAAPVRVAQFREARDAGLQTLTYGTLAQGLLSGKYSAQSTFDTADRRHRLGHFSRESWPRNAALLSVLHEVAGEAGRTPAQVAIRWVLDSGASSTVIAGARSPEQVTENHGALGWSLSNEQFERLATAGRAPIQTEQTSMVMNEQG